MILLDSEKCPKDKKGFLNQKLKILIKYMIHSFRDKIQYFLEGIFNSKNDVITFFRKIQFKNLNLAVFNSTKYSFNLKTQVSPRVKEILEVWFSGKWTRGRKDKAAEGKIENENVPS